MLPSFPATSAADNGAWTNHELHAINSLDSSAEKSALSGGEEKDREGLVRNPSNGESAAIVPSLFGRSTDTIDEKTLARHLSKGDSVVDNHRVLGTTKSTETASEFNSGWSTGTDTSPVDSQEQVFFEKTNLSARNLRNFGRLLQTESEDESAPQSRGFQSADGTFPTASHSSSESESPNSQSHSSQSQATLYTSDASSTYNSVNVKREPVNLDALPTGVIASPPKRSRLWEDEDSSKVLALTLDNVEYMSTFDEASNDADLSTLDEPISPDNSMGVFSLGAFIPKIVPLDMQSEISSIYTNRRGNGRIAGEEGGRDLEIGAASITTSTAVTVRISNSFRELLHERSKMEIFFLWLIGFSAVTLLVLFVVILTGS